MSNFINPGSLKHDANEFPFDYDTGLFKCHENIEAHTHVLEFGYSEGVELYKIEDKEFLSVFELDSFPKLWHLIIDNIGLFLYKDEIEFSDLDTDRLNFYINNNFNLFLDMKSIKDFINYYVYMSDYLNIASRLGLSLQDFVIKTEVLLYKVYQGALEGKK